MHDVKYRHKKLLLTMKIYVVEIWGNTRARDITDEFRGDSVRKP